MTTKLNVFLTQSYRLTSDLERNFIVEQRVTVDPTKAPGYKPAADGSIPPTREEWRSIEQFWPMTGRGLAAAIECVALRQAVSDAADEGSANLFDFAAGIRYEYERLRKEVSGLVENKAEVAR